jgi:hypothetical protein
MLKTIITRIQTKVQRCRLPLVVPALVIGMSSCVYEDEPIKADDNSTDSKYEITFTINVGKARSGLEEGVDEWYTDDDGNNLSDGTWYENYIDPDRMEVTIWKGVGGYGGANGYSEKLNIQKVVRLSNSKYEVHCDKVDLPSDFTIAITAGWPYTVQQRLDKYSSSSNIFKNLAFFCMLQGSEYPYHYGNKTTGLGLTIVGSSQEELDYSNNGENTYYVPSAETPMPMYGCKAYSASSIVTQPTAPQVDLGEISMLRAMAKLIVINSTGYDFDAVKLKYYYDLGLCGPVASSGNLNTKGTAEYAFDYTNFDEFNMPGGFTSAFGFGFDNQNPMHRCQNLPFQEYTNSDGKKIYVVYILPYNNALEGKSRNTNTPDAPVPSQINVTIKGLDYPIEFQTQDKDGVYDGVYYDLWRNHMYIYDITKANLETKLLYVVTKFDEYTASDITFN